MKRWLAMALPLLAAMVGPASAEAVWTGEVIIKTASAGCGSAWQVGDFGSAIFRPVIPEDSANGTTSRLVFNGKNTVVSHEVNGAFSGDIAYQGTVISRSGILTAYSPPTGIANASVSPATFTAATQTLRVRGVITRFANITGCNVSFDGAFVKKL